MGKLGSEFVVIVIEILGEEKMAIGVVIIRFDGEFRGLHTVLSRNCFGFGVLLRNQSGKCQLAELKFCFYTKECGASSY